MHWFSPAQVAGYVALVLGIAGFLQYASARSSSRACLSSDIVCLATEIA
jgi:hypothetical protein